ncbi:hypothetical protein JVV71_20125, partial [Vibrio cholerae O1]|nr:hypothetical protein [Vibrio cholerae O1]
GAFVALFGLGLLAGILPGLDPSASLAPIADKFALPFSAIVAVVIAVVLAIIGIWWLSLQIPRKDAAKPLRLQQDARTGITSV